METQYPLKDSQTKRFTAYILWKFCDYNTDSD